VSSVVALLEQFSFQSVSKSGISFRWTCPRLQRVPDSGCRNWKCTGRKNIVHM